MQLLLNYQRWPTIVSAYKSNNPASYRSPIQGTQLVSLEDASKDD